LPEKLAELARILFGYLLLDEPTLQPPDICDYRTVQPAGVSSGLEELIYSCEFKLAWFAEYCLSQGDTPPSIYGRFSVSDDPVRVAQVMRSGFTTRPLSAALEEAGAVIMRSFEPGFHGFYHRRQRVPAHLHEH